MRLTPYWISVLLDEQFRWTVIGIAIAASSGLYAARDSKRNPLWTRVLIVLGAIVGIAAAFSNTAESLSRQQQLDKRDTHLTARADQTYLKANSLLTQSRDILVYTQDTLRTARGIDTETHSLNSQAHNLNAKTAAVEVETKTAESGIRSVEGQTNSIASRAQHLQQEASSEQHKIDVLLSRTHITMSDYVIVLNPRQPFESQFYLTNNSESTLKNVEVTCTVDELLGVNGLQGYALSVLGFPTFTLDPGQSTAVHPCSKIETSNDLVLLAIMRMPVTYTTDAAPNRPIHQVFRFITEPQANGGLVWVQSIGG